MKDKISKQKWIGSKIKELIKEGKNKEQAVAISYSMFKELPKHQSGDYTEDTYNHLQKNFNVSVNPSMIGNSVPVVTPNTQVNPSNLNIAGVPSEEEIRMNEMNSNVDEVNSFVDSGAINKGVGTGTGNLNNFFDNEISKDKVDSVNTPNKNNQIGDRNTQMFNPFGDIGLEQSLMYAGQGFAEGNGGKAALGTGLSLLKGARNFMSGFALSTEEERRRKEYEENIQDEEVYQSLKEGGKITNGQKMTGQYLTEDNPMKANVEVEQGEYTENSQTGQVQEVVGEKHDNGGVKVNLPDESKVLSDYTKIGSNNVKKFKEEFGINIRKTDTYADVLDKFNKKQGLDKILKEEEDIYSSIEKQKEDKDIPENVSKLNMFALQKKLNKVLAEKEVLKSNEQQAFNLIFNEQEKKPKTENTKEMKEGGTVDQDLDFLSHKYGIDKPRLKELMQSGGTTGEDERLEDFIALAKSLGYEGTTDFKLDGEVVDENFKKMQQFVAKKNPQAVKDYFTKYGQPITADGLDTIKKTAPELFEKIGIDINTPSADIPEYGRQRLQEAFSESEKMPENFWTSQFGDGRWLYRAPSVGTDLLTRDRKNVGLTGVEQPDTKAISDSLNDKINDSLSTEEIVTGELYKDKKSYAGAGFPLMPVDFILPPDARESVRKHEVNLPRMELNKVGVEPNLTEIERQRQLVQDFAKNLPPAQAAALISTTLGQTQDSANKAITSQTNQNAGMQMKVDEYNMNAGAKEQLTNINLAQDYENKTMAAITNQQRDLRKYFNDLNDMQRFNYNYIERRNLLNQMTPNFNTTTGGNVQFAGGDPLENNFDEQQAMLEWYNNATAKEKKDLIESGKTL